MCGIVGAASITSFHEFNWLRDANNVISHRGPDDEGIWISEDSKIGFAHRRLSIIDLSSSGHQPMMAKFNSLVMVFNGEIYNFQDLRKILEKRGHQFRSNSDSEVLLASYSEWGVECLNMLDGMFAFAIYDKRNRKLILARDRAGEKPLFYRYDNGVLKFASELKALLADPAMPRRISREALDCYLAFGYVPGDLCILDGYNKLLPAHALIYDTEIGDCRLVNYWRPPKFDNNLGVSSEQDLVDELDGLIHKSVKQQLVADVPVGVLLSGGVDSSLITAYAARESRVLKTFTISLPENKYLDESYHARLISDHFSTDHTELVAESLTFDLLPIIARQFDEPISDSSAIPTHLVCKLISGHCKVALGGDGGDELFGGYKHYNQLLIYHSYFRHIPYKLRQFVAKSIELQFPVGFKGRNWIQNLDWKVDTSLPQKSPLFDFTARRRLLKQSFNGKSAERIMSERCTNDFDLIVRATKMDFENYLPDDVLVKVDRASMLNSLEVRAPFLSRDLIDFAFGKVPSHLKVTKHDRKILPKKLCERVLPPSFDLKRKQGFSLPINQWILSGKMDEIIEFALDDKDSIFDPVTVKMLLNGLKNGRQNGERIYSLVMFELWRKSYRIEL